MWQDLVVCAVSDKTNPKYSDYNHFCTFGDIIVLVNHFINDLIILSTLVTVGVFVYFGIRLVTSYGNPGALKDAKSGIMNVVKGYVVILCAWVVVYTIMNVLVGPAYSLLGNPQ